MDHVTAEEKAYSNPPRRPSTYRWSILLSLPIFILIWWAIVRLGDFPQFILPGPAQVAARFWQALVDGSLGRDTLATMQEVLLGLLIGVVFASLFGYLLAKSKTFERLFSPYIVASQAIPVVAIAPLLVIWFGPGMSSKVLITSLIVFFPVLINTVVGLRSVPDDLRDLMRSLLASRWQTFTKLEAPAALPVFLGGLRIGATLAVIGSVVGEFVGADRGLGFMINRARGLYDTALVFVAVGTLVCLALSLYGAVVFAERKLLSWQQPAERTLQGDIE